MKNDYRRTLLGVGVVVLITCAVGAGAQQQPIGTDSPKWFQPIPNASVQLEPLTDFSARVTVRGQGPEELRIDAAGFTVSTTPQGVRIVTAGLATLSWGNRTDKVKAEALELTIAKGGGFSMSAKRIEVLR
jgi:hypothetical protein